MEQYRELFPVTRECAYLNHAATGPMPTPVAEAVTRYVGEQSRLGSLSTAGRPRAETRAKMARLLGARPEEVAIVKNVPEGISTVASGIAWRDGDNVVTTAMEFPANVYPWLNQARSGVSVRFVPTREGRVPLEELLGAADARTRAISVSFVEFANGFRHDLAAIGAFCRARGIYFVVDAIQGLGVLPIDVARQGIDFLAASSHKWLCAPSGVGWLYCRRELLDEIWPSEVGQSSVVARASYLDYELKLKPSAERFESGVLNEAGIQGLDAALDLFLEVGAEAIERRLLELTGRLIEGLLARGYEVLSPRGAGERSGIVSFRGGGRSPEELLARLGEAGVVVAVREGGVRVSPNFYNTPDEIDRLLEALPG